MDFSLAVGRFGRKMGKGCKRASLTSVSFAEDTTIVGMSGEIDEGVRTKKGVMNEWEKRNYDAKEEVLEVVQMREAMCVLGSWMSTNVDVNNRITRANGLWWKVKAWLKSSRLNKR